MATMPVQLDEEALIREVIAGLELPSGVKFKRVALGTEWTGEPAWFVEFEVSKKVRITAGFLDRLGAIRHDLHERVRQYGLEKWAFVKFREGR